MDIGINDIKITYESINGDIKNDICIYNILHKLKFGDKIHGISFTDSEKILKYINQKDTEFKYSFIYYKDTMLLLKI